MAKLTNKIIEYIVGNCIKLKNKYLGDKDLPIDYICIFSQSENEYQDLLAQASEVGKMVEETPTGPLFKFQNKVLKIRKPDKTRPQRGDVDFTTDYQQLKAKYLDNKHFKLIKREKFEMVELWDDEFDVLVYFSSIPPSKLLGIS